MNKETLKALKGSIKKWEKIVDGTGVDDGADNCALCDMFFDSAMDFEYCKGCPVSKSTGRRGCTETPYEDWLESQSHFGRFHHPHKAHNDETVMCAVLELEFLKSLLPKGKS